MSEIIDCEDTYCTECGVRVVKSPRRKYCSEECARKAQLRQKAEYWHKKYGSGSLESSLETSLESSSKVVSQSKKSLTTQSPTSDLAIPANSQLTEFLEPLLFSFTQQFHAFQTEVRELLEEKNQAVDELLFVMVQDPDFRKQLLAREKQIHQAMKLIQELGGSQPLFKIRKVLQTLEGLSKRTAEEILREAEKRLRQQHDRNQRSMEDYS